jgi:ribosomal protein S18 acetylase RimI-like enzyme
MVFVSPMTGSATQPIVVALGQAVCAAQDRDRMTMLQALLDPPQHREAKALTAAGFERLSELIYMQRPADAPEAPLQLDGSFELLHWSDQHRGHFADAILASYEQTLDCPGLVGLRDIDDIIAGHMATGEFRPKLWFAVRCDDQPVAVMLLNVVPRRQSMELVYLGIASGWRGRGIGRRLLTHGLGLAGGQGATNIILAVDQGNRPALRLYRSLRFTSTTRKLAMIYNLR